MCVTLVDDAFVILPAKVSISGPHYTQTVGLGLIVCANLK